MPALDPRNTRLGARPGPHPHRAQRPPEAGSPSRALRSLFSLQREHGQQCCLGQGDPSGRGGGVAPPGRCDGHGRRGACVYRERGRQEKREFCPARPDRDIGVTISSDIRTDFFSS